MGEMQFMRIASQEWEVLVWVFNWEGVKWSEARGFTSRRLVRGQEALRGLSARSKKKSRLAELW